jgi:uncharacterized protein YjdB
MKYRKLKKFISSIIVFSLLLNLCSDLYNREIEALGTRVIWYSAYMRSVGWHNNVAEPNPAGTIAGKRPLEKIKITPNAGTVQYDVHVSNVGWQNNYSNGAEAGIFGQHIEAVRVRLSGLSGYSVYYRVYMRDDGWSTWSKNGIQAGSTGDSQPIYAIQVFITNNAISIKNTYIYTDNDINGFANTVTAAYEEATRGFITYYNIVFTPRTHGLGQTSNAIAKNELSGYCPPTNHDKNSVCFNSTSQYDFCGKAENCHNSLTGNINTTGHHKGAGRLINVLPAVSTMYVMRVVDFRICRYDSTDVNPHFNLRGLAYLNGFDAITSAIVEDYVSTIQHELSHNLGVKGHCVENGIDKTPKEDCIMKPYTFDSKYRREMNKWCSYCSVQIKK